ncbi:MAG: TonB-dependent receptor [Bacteroidetes bacterium]|nr:MAG: TonB-dependent receptor [Bacteroidota bacterium]
MARFSRHVFLPVFILFAGILSAQPGGGRGGMNMTGRFYGKIVDQSGKKGVEFATVTLFQSIFDSVSKTQKRKLITGQITESNGDFNLENVPVRGKFTLRIIAIGYDSLIREVSFSQGSFDKDLGNIAIKVRAQEMKEVVVDGTAPTVELKPDRRIYTMDKNAIATGGTAEDALKTIPTVSVDLDGNVSLRNSAPQIFVDGRPTTLTLDQIPADAIQTVEVITSPSAKYDASGGGAGIINIVLKKDRRFGYNGNIRAGIDQRTKMNGGADINVRQGKINMFASANVNQRLSISEGETTRLNLFETPNSSVLQTSHSEFNNIFITGRGGLDYFIDNRNTLTLSGSYTTGRFKPYDEQTAATDTLHASGTTSSNYERITDSKRMFENYGASLLYKKLFTKEGKEWTADINYNSASSENSSKTTTNYFDTGQLVPDRTALQQQSGGGGTRFLTGQTDFVTPLNDKMKIETGARVSVRLFTSGADVAVYNEATAKYDTIENKYSDYEYTDNVYAAYGTFSHAIKTKFSYQAGLRLESSDYRGKLNATGETFRNLYPLSFFPSASASYKPNDKHDFQLSMSRRINRPNFFQLMPFTDYSDSLNLSRGNPLLKPEFAYKAEFTYMRIFSRETNILASVFYRNTQGLITRYQVTEYDSTLGRDALINTYENASYSYTYGGDLSATIAAKKWLEINPSVSAYYTGIDGSNISTGLTNALFSWDADLNLTFRFPKNITLQLMGEYNSKTANAGGGGGGRMGGMGGGGMYGGSTSSVQGYNEPNYSLDLAARYSFPKTKVATISVSVNDVLKTRISASHSESEYFVQDSWRVRDQQIFRLNFSYRFGKFDAALFKRKNTKSGGDGMEMGM